MRILMLLVIFGVFLPLSFNQSLLDQYAQDELLDAFKMTFKMSQTYTVYDESNSTLNSISEKYYGTQDFKVLILAYNPILYQLVKNVETDPIPEGTAIILPFLTNCIFYMPYTCIRSCLSLEGKGLRFENFKDIVSFVLAPSQKNSPIRPSSRMLLASESNTDWKNYKSRILENEEGQWHNIMAIVTALVNGGVGVAASFNYSSPVTSKRIMIASLLLNIGLLLIDYGAGTPAVLQDLVKNPVEMIISIKNTEDSGFDLYGCIGDGENSDVWISQSTIMQGETLEIIIKSPGEKFSAIEGAIVCKLPKRLQYFAIYYFTSSDTNSFARISVNFTSISQPSSTLIKNFRAGSSKTLAGGQSMRSFDHTLGNLSLITEMSITKNNLNPSAKVTLRKWTNRFGEIVLMDKDEKPHFLQAPFHTQSSLVMLDEENNTLITLERICPSHNYYWITTQSMYTMVYSESNQKIIWKELTNAYRDAYNARWIITNVADRRLEIKNVDFEGTFTCNNFLLYGGCNFALENSDSNLWWFNGTLS